MATILPNDRCLILGPRLAAKIGLNEAILLQQLQYWIDKSKNLVNGHIWVYRTYDQWAQEFPFWCRRTIASILKNLKEKNLIIIGQFSQDKSDRTIWYRLNKEQVDKLINENCTMENEKSASSDSAEFALADSAEFALSLYEHRLHSETTLQNNNKNIISSSEQVPVDNFQKLEPVPIAENRPLRRGESEFQLFWNLYPLKKARRTALEAFLKGGCHLTIGNILNALKSQIIEKRTQQDLGLFCPPWKHPATWLRSESWTDEVLTLAELKREASQGSRHQLTARQRQELVAQEEARRIRETIEDDETF